MRTITQQEHENMVNYWVQNAKQVTIYRVLEIINKYKTYHNGAHWTVLKEIKEEIKALNGGAG